MKPDWRLLTVSHTAPGEHLRSLHTVASKPCKCNKRCPQSAAAIPVCDFRQPCRYDRNVANYREAVIQNDHTLSTTGTSKASWNIDFDFQQMPLMFEAF